MTWKTCFPTLCTQSSDRFDPGEKTRWRVQQLGQIAIVKLMFLRVGVAPEYRFFTGAIKYRVSSLVLNSNQVLNKVWPSRLEPERSRCLGSNQLQQSREWIVTVYLWRNLSSIIWASFRQAENGLIDWWKLYFKKIWNDTEAALERIRLCTLLEENHKDLT